MKWDMSNFSSNEKPGKRSNSHHCRSIATFGNQAVRGSPATCNLELWAQGVGHGLTEIVIFSVAGYDFNPMLSASPLSSRRMTSGI